MAPLSTRKKAVLAAVIESYIRTGEPVGSKAVVMMLEKRPATPFFVIRPLERPKVPRPQM